MEEGPLFGPRVEVGGWSGPPAKLKDSEITQAAIMHVLPCSRKDTSVNVLFTIDTKSYVVRSS